MRRKKIFVVQALFIALMYLASCKKDSKVIVQDTIADSSHLSITNASPDVSSLDFYLGNRKITLPDSPLYYGLTTRVTYVSNRNAAVPTQKETPYINIPTGYQQIGFGSALDNIFSVSVTSYFQPGGNYSVFITDTVNRGQLQCVLLTDKIALTDTSEAQIRFLNLAPDAPPLDVWAFPDAGPDGYKLFSSCAYLPFNYHSLVDAESFSLIRPGPYYFIATEAGTQNILLEGGLIINGKSVNTIYAKGFLAGNGQKILDVGVISYIQ